MSISVQLGDDVAPETIEPALEQLGVGLEPVHPGHRDPTLSTYYTVRVPEGRDAEELREALHRLDGVVAAYVEPPPALPG
jgi:hypothetical protein